MGEARRRGTLDQRIQQARMREIERVRLQPALAAARRDPEWKAGTRRERNDLIVKHARALGLIE